MAGRREVGGLDVGIPASFAAVKNLIACMTLSCLDEGKTSCMADLSDAASPLGMEVSVRFSRAELKRSSYDLMLMLCSVSRRPICLKS